MTSLPRIGPADDHFHSTAGSGDALAALPAMCERALELGLRSLCLTEHIDYDETLPDYGYFDFDVVRRAHAAAVARYGDRLDLRLGVEVDFRPCFRDRMLADVPRYAVDFVLGSVHSYRDRHLLEVVGTKLTWTPDELAALYADYFASSRLLIASGVIDVLAHFDYPLKLGIRPPEMAVPGYDAELDATLALAVQHNVGIEVNTKRAHRGTPLAASEEIIRRYRALGGTRVTLGSDAHRVQDLGAGLDIGAAALRRAGFPAQTIFRNRQVELLPLR